MVYPALKVILVNRLQKSLYLCEKAGHLQGVDWGDRANKASQNCWLEKFPINRVQRLDRICYVSAIALKLSQQQSGSSVELAHCIAEDLRLPLPPDTEQRVNVSEPAFSREVGRQVEGNFTVEVKPPGWIYLSLTDRGLAAWLQGLVEFTDWGDRQPTTSTPSLSPPSTISTISTLPKAIDPFQILHSHARCCALLRSGIRENLIHLHKADRHGYHHLNHPYSIPWLTAEQVLQCQQPLEQQLMGQIIEVMDYLSEPKPAIPKQWRLAQELSQAFYQFHANCQIFGEVKASGRNLAQARLGLVLICQRLLQRLLQNLQVHAPTEL
jgi:hypothetical protein